MEREELVNRILNINPECDLDDCTTELVGTYLNELENYLLLSPKVEEEILEYKYEEVKEVHLAEITKDENLEINEYENIFVNDKITDAVEELNNYGWNTEYIDRTVSKILNCNGNINVYAYVVK